MALKIWTTNDEIKWINKIGIFYLSKEKGIDSENKEPEVFEPETTEQKNYVICCLTGYLNGFNLRTNWGDINKSIIYNHAIRRLKKLSNKEE